MDPRKLSLFSINSMDLRIVKEEWVVNKKNTNETVISIKSVPKHTKPHQKVSIIGSLGCF